MKRPLLALAATTLLAALAPGSALASHHARGHHRHGHRTHVRRFGSLDPVGSTTTPSSSSSSGIGTIFSFQNGVLTIRLGDGSMVSGTVTGDTGIACTTSGSSSSGGDQSSSSGGDQSSSSGGDQTSSSGGDQSSGSEDQTSSTGDQSSGSGGQTSVEDDQNQQTSGTDDDSSQGTTSSCSTADLTTGKTVLGAELRLTSTGNTWERIDLGS